MSDSQRSPQLASESGSQRRFRSVAEIKRELFPQLPPEARDENEPGSRVAELLDNYVGRKAT